MEVIYMFVLNWFLFISLPVFTVFYWGYNKGGNCLMNASKF